MKDENRTPNQKCDNPKCNVLVYKRPKLKRKFCCRECYFRTVTERKDVNCKFCKRPFYPKRIDQRFCSHSCSASIQRGIYSKLKFRSKTQFRLHILREKFNFNSCMVDGCGYNKVYNVHRFLEGKNGGKYEIGNMFAICPNHHAEYHNGLVKFEKVSNCKLKII
jgi:hypothetical protein